jgi:hypothetical protein
MMLRAFAFVALLMLAACGGGQNSMADDAAIAQARYVSSEPASITLFTVVNTRSGAGAHSALLVNASETVLFDPAGSFKLRFMPERGDVLYGASPMWMNAYKDYHARETHFVRTQTLLVSPAVAEQLLVAVKSNGAVAKAHCANSISRILGQVPGFEQIGSTYWPLQLEEAFGQNPNVTNAVITDATVDKSHGVAFIDKDDTAALAAAGLTP